MSSELMEYLAQDIIAEREAKWQARFATERQAHRQAEQEVRRHVEREAYRTHLQTERETLATMVVLRFPDAPLRLTTLIHKITEVGRLEALRTDVSDLPDLTTVEQRLRDAV